MVSCFCYSLTSMLVRLPAEVIVLCLGSTDYTTHTQWVHPDSKRTWFNHTSCTCIDWEDLNFRVLDRSVSVTGLIVSIIFLIISIAIFKLGP